MKKKIHILLILIPFFAFSQNKIKLKYQSTNDREARVYNKLNNILTLSIVCDDDLAKGKKFLIRKEEIIDGKIISNDNLVSCEDKTYSVMLGKDTLKYKVNLCDRTKPFENNDKQKIIFGGKLLKDSLKILVDYPSMTLDEKLKADYSFIFKPLQTENDKGYFELIAGKEYPIIALTPPLKAKNGFSSYCLVNSQKTKNFYKEYNIERYYVYYLKIE